MHWHFNNFFTYLCQDIINQDIQLSQCSFLSHLLLLLCILFQPLPVSLGLLHHFFMCDAWRETLEQLHKKSVNDSSLENNYQHVCSTYQYPVAGPSIWALWQSERRSNCPHAGNRSEPRGDTHQTGREGAGDAPYCSAHWLTSPRAPGTCRG